MHIKELYFRREMKRCPNVTVVCVKSKVEGLPDYLANSNLEHIMLHLGEGLVPKAPYTLTEEGWGAELRFQGRPFSVFCPWDALYSVEAFFPPTTPGRPAQIRRAA